MLVNNFGVELSFSDKFATFPTNKIDGVSKMLVSSIFDNSLSEYSNFFAFAVVPLLRTTAFVLGLLPEFIRPLAIL